MYLPVIALTSGDPAGVGPELCLKALHHPAVKNKCRLVILGDKNHLNHISSRLFKKKFSSSLGSIAHIECGGKKHVRMGRANGMCGYASGVYISEAVKWAMAGKVDAIVTAPINKKSFLMGGWGEKYTGHTEMLASLTKSKDVALMLVSGVLRAVHVTSHIKLKDVSKNLTLDRIVKTITLATKGLNFLGISNPRTGVCSLNPHGGDDGIMGDEEKKLIFPAVKKARSSGLDVEGPFPSDALWPLVLNKRFDAGVAMYHDQGQIPVKLQGSSVDKLGRYIPGGVNFTLGLPIIRTSPAHGTAYDIAGKGIASEKSLVDAIDLAAEISLKKRSGGCFE